MNTISRRVRRTAIVVAGTVALCAGTLMPFVSPASAEVTFNGYLNIREAVQIPCGNGGATHDFVEFEGPMHFVVATTVDGAGGFHSDFFDQHPAETGYGFANNTRYLSIREERVSVNGRVGQESTSIAHFTVIGQGPGTKYLVHDTLHLTISPDGQPHASFDHAVADCK